LVREIAAQYLSDRKAFDSTAKHWTETYAKPAVSKASKSKDRLRNASEIIELE
jgi:hypothetical protein